MEIKDWIILIIIILLCFVIVFGLVSCGMKDAEKNHSCFTKPGICPNCGAKLVKGVYGQYGPNFVWYCPDCP